MERQKTNRIVGLDIARAFAILGMVLVNFQITMGATTGGPNWLHSFAALFEGRAAALFVVLAGVGASLASRRAREENHPSAKRAARIRLAKRALFLFVIGWLFFPIWPADILHFYGAYLALGALALFLPTRRLWLLVFGAMVISLGFLVTFDPTMNWNLETLEYSGITTIGGFSLNLFFNGFHPVFPWVAFYFFGMWLGRTDLASKAWRKSLVIGAIALVAVSEAASWLALGPRGSDLSQLDSQSALFLFSTEPLPPFPLYLVAGAGTAVLVICFAIWLGEKLPGKLSEPLVSTGQLALTIYVAHVIVGMGVLDAFGLLDDQSLSWAFITSALFSAVAIIAAWLWRKKFKRGPLEALMHRLLD
jgi:uncharacterized protein